MPKKHGKRKSLVIDGETSQGLSSKKKHRSGKIIDGSHASTVKPLLLGQDQKKKAVAPLEIADEESFTLGEAHSVELVENMELRNPAVETHDLENSSRSHAFDSNGSSIANEAALVNATEVNEGVGVDSLGNLHPSGGNSPTADEAKDATNGLLNTDVGIATNSPRKETDSPEDVFSSTLSELWNMFDTDSSLNKEAEDPTLVNVGCYKVGQEYAATAEHIMCKHGDIVAGTSFKGQLPSQLLEIVCTIYQKLEKSDFIRLTLPELESMRRDVDDCGIVNVDVGWLAKRLDDICDAKKVLQQAAHVKDERNELGTENAEIFNEKS